MNQIAPILAALRRHRLAVLLIAMQVALACAVLVNASDMMVQRWQAVRMPSGVDEAAIGCVHLSGFDAERGELINQQVLELLRQQPAVQAAGVINGVPFGFRSGTVGLSVDGEAGQGEPWQGVVDLYVAGPGSLDALGLRLRSGRMPNDEDYASIGMILPDAPVALLTRSLAERMWPWQNPVGKQVGQPPFRMTVIGVVEDVVIPQPGSRGLDSSYWSIFIPAQPGAQLTGNYVYRAEPSAVLPVQHALADALPKRLPDAVLDTRLSRPMAQLRSDYFAKQRNMLWLLGGVITVMLTVTAFGIVGLASFWVQQRTRQIGVRRALGATRGDVLRYFQTENFLIVTGGVLLGMVLAFGLNQFLMQQYELQRLPLYYLPIGAIVLWLLGQVAVLWPALKAAAIPPATATRSV